MANHKRVTSDELSAIRREAHANGQTIVFTNGCFDLLHAGHVQLLQQARQLGDLLIVAINTDRSIRHLKGMGRPIVGEDDRAFVLSALACVDYVILFDTDTPIPLLHLLKPDVLVKGGQYRHDQVVGWEIVEAYGGRVETIQMRDGLSTTEMVRRIRQGLA